MTSCPRVHRVRAAEPSLVTWMDNQRLRNFLNTRPEFWFHFGLLLAQKRGWRCSCATASMLVSNELRVARVPLRMAQHCAPGAWHRIASRLPHQDLHQGPQQDHLHARVHREPP